jgi:hypothetical protein
MDSTIDYETGPRCPVCDELLELDSRLVSTWGTADGVEPYRDTCPSCHTVLEIYEHVTRTWVAEIA